METATASSPAIKITCLILRVFTFVLLLISLIVISTNKQTLHVQAVNGVIYEFKLGFTDSEAYSYMLSTIVIGMVYFLMQIAFSIYNLVMKVPGLLLLDFYGDKFISYLLATGAAAGFGVTNDLKKVIDENVGLKFTTFYEKGFATSSLLLLAFVCAAALSILSSLAMIPKKV